jgi:hypothetical protein
MCNKKLGHQVMFPPSNGMGLLRRGKVAGMLVVTRETWLLYHMWPECQSKHLNSMTKLCFRYYLHSCLSWWSGFWLGCRATLRSASSSNDNRQRVSQSRSNQRVLHFNRAVLAQPVFSWNVMKGVPTWNHRAENLTVSCMYPWKESDHVTEMTRLSGCWRHPLF